VASRYEDEGQSPDEGTDWDDMIARFGDTWT